MTKTMLASTLNVSGRIWLKNVLEKRGDRKAEILFFQDEIYEVSFLSFRFSNLLNQTRKGGN